MGFRKSVHISFPNADKRIRKMDEVERKLQNIANEHGILAMEELKRIAVDEML